MQKVSFVSDALNRKVRLRICANGIRTIEQNGGLDAFLMSVSDSSLGSKELAVKRLVARKAAEKRGGVQVDN
jgi:large subunit ribosomal protein L28